MSWLDSLIGYLFFNEFTEFFYFITFPEISAACSFTTGGGGLCMAGLGIEPMWVDFGLNPRLEACRVVTLGQGGT